MTGEPYAFPQLIRAARDRCGLSLSEAAVDNDAVLKS